MPCYPRFTPDTKSKVEDLINQATKNMKQQRRDYQKKLKADIAHYVRNASTKKMTEQEIEDETEGVYNLVRDIALDSCVFR